VKILLLDDAKKRKVQLKEAIQKQYEIIDCTSSNELMTAVESEKLNLALLDMGTWKKGKAIYNYFHIGKKLENIPVILYNAEEDAYFITDRARHDRDRILSNPTEIETIVDTVQQVL
jgi:response regulator RpfG family c-di-GMP phosphodiesterase